MDQTNAIAKIGKNYYTIIDDLIYRQAIQKIQKVREGQPKTTTTTSRPNITHPTTTAAAKTITTISVPIEYLLIGLGLGIVVAGFLHCIIRRKRTKAISRHIRKGEAIDDDEDDLLISQMYS